MPLAKLSRPALRRIQPRPRLFRHLDEGVRAGPVWVVGPAGSGKTTLVAGWAVRRGGPILWFKVDEADGELATLFHYLGMAAAQLLRGNARLPVFTAETQGGVAAFSRRFFRALWTSLPAGARLVLDDCHEADGSRHFREALRCACEERPEDRTLVLVSRAEPPPELARLLSQGALATIGPAELRLTPLEAKGVARLRGAKLAPRAVSRLQERVDGWAAGLVLLLSARDEAQASGSDAIAAPLLFDYLAGEVLDGLDPTARRVLMETALLGSVSSATAVELTGTAAASQVLSGLARRGWFVNRHGGRDPVFTFHPLFRELLLARGREEIAPERLFTLRRTSARFQAERGDVEGAFDALRQAGASAELVKLVLSHAQRTIAEGRFETLRRWILELPAEARQREPWLEYWLGVSWSGFDPGELRRSLERAYEGFWRRGDPVGCVHACAAVVDSFLTEWGDLHPLDRWGAALEDLRRRWPELPDPVLAGFFACAQFTVFLSRRPDDPEARTWEERAAALATHGATPVLRRKSAFAVWHLSLWRGDLPLVRKMMESLRPDRANWRESSPNLAWHALQARLLASGGQGAEGCAEAVAGLVLAQSAGAHFLDVGLRGGAVLAAIMGEDLDLAETHLAGAELEPGGGEPFNLWYVQFMSGAIAFRRGRLTRAGDELREAEAAARTAGNPLLALWAEVGQAAVARARSERDSFERRIGHAEEESRRDRAHIAVWWCLLLRAAWLVREEPERAGEVFLEALVENRAHGPFVPMWLGADDLSRLSAAAWAQGGGRELVRAFVEARRLAPPAGLQELDAWPYPATVRVLGPFHLERRGAVVEFGRKRPRRPLDLLRALVALGGSEVPEWRLIEQLWPDAEGDSAHHALEMALHRLRKLTGDVSIVEQRDGRLSIDRRMCGVDAFALEGLLAEPTRADGSREDLDAAAELLRRILAAYRGPLLADEEASWAAAARERVRRLLRSRVEAVTRALQREGWGEESAGLWKLAAERDAELAAAPLRLVGPTDRAAGD
jgi:LuxR family transcriptional regulator, maltose regulon positive regulatory protein